MRFSLYITLLLFLTSCGGFLHSGSRGSLSDATEKSQSKDPDERKVGTTHTHDEEYREEYDYSEKIKHYEKDEYNSANKKLGLTYVSTNSPQYKSKTRDSLQLAQADTTTTIDSSLIVPLEGIDLGIEKSLLSAEKKSTYTIDTNATIDTSVTLETSSQKDEVAIKTTKEITKPSPKKEGKDFIFGFEADPELLLSRNYSKALGGTLFAGGRIIDRTYFLLRIGYHQYRIGSEDSLVNRFEYNELHSFSFGGEVLHYFEKTDNPIAAPYFTGRADVTVVNFDYKNALIDSVNNETISDDDITGFSASAGAGVTFFNTLPIRVGCFITPGFRLYALSTTEDFDNDLFKPELFISAGARLWFDFGYKRNKRDLKSESIEYKK